MKEKYILIAIPMESEFEALQERFKDIMVRKTIDGIKGYVFRTPKGNVFAYASKVGRTNTCFDLTILSRKIDIQLIINIGTAGSLQSFIKPLDVIVATTSAYYDVDLTPFGYKYGQMSGCPAQFETTLNDISFKTDKEFKIHLGTVLTADSFITKENLKQNIIDKFDTPLCIDMEGAVFGHVAYLLNRPYVLIRAISDSPSESMNVDQHQKLVLDSCRNAVDVLCQILGTN